MRSQFDAHMLNEHPQRFSTGELSGLAEVCEKHALPRCAGKCPFCQEETGNTRVHYRHVARHLEDVSILSFESLDLRSDERLPDQSMHHHRPEISTLPKIPRSEIGVVGKPASGYARREADLVVKEEYSPVDESSSKRADALSKPEIRREPSDRPPSSRLSTHSHSFAQSTSMSQIRPPLEPSCAICGAPPYPECPHEGESLQRALQEAQDRWTGVQRIR